MSNKKEKIGINTTPATLFVGCGGIGSKIVTRVAQRCAPGEAKNIRFVAMDTDANDLRGVKSTGANITYVQTSSPQSVYDYLKNDTEARTKWFPCNTTMYSKTVSEGAGQVRAISRLALNATIKTGQIQKLYKAIDDLFLKDGEDLKQALRVVICSTAAGGTGSGIAMTVGMLIREYMHKHYREKSLIVRGYILLPGVLDTVISTETERESLRRNGYATIKEINAFMMKASGFCGVRKDLARFDDLHIDVPTTSGGVERLDNLPFDFCFLLDRVDSSQESMQSLDQYMTFAARSLYEQSIGPMQRKAFSMEDNIIKEFANGENLGRNRFGGIGAATLQYPYEDIADYIAYSRAIDRIGSEDNVGEWIKYDKRFAERRAEFRKKRASSIETEPVLREVYISEVNNGEQRFDNDVKRYLANDVDRVQEETQKSVRTYLKHFDDELLNEFLKLPELKGTMLMVQGLAMEKDYEGDEDLRGKASDNLGLLRGYERIVKMSAASTAKARARAILHDAPAVDSEAVKPYHLETLLKSHEGAMHPNAIRYMLYLLENELEKRTKKVKKETEDCFAQLQLFSPQADNEDYFDVKGGASKDVTEKSIDDVVALENTDVSVIQKLFGGGLKPLWEKLNEVFPAYVAAINNYRDALIKEASYSLAANYLAQLSRQFESFYNSFETKVVLLSRAKEDIVSKLKFKKGDSIRYICSTKPQMDLLLKMCPEGSEGLMLPEKLNAKVFETVKKNAESDRLAAYDTYSSYTKADVFDDVLLGYFKESVRDDCDEIINLNIIKALFTEQRLQAFLDANALKEEGEELIQPRIDDEQRNTYLRDALFAGRKLASPGISCENFNEPRELSLCSYSETLNNMREMNVQQTLESIGFNAIPSDTVSKYEISFFGAVYNITPDKLARFRSPEDCKTDEQYGAETGIYYKAYQDYVKKIGPDSTKSATISLHIDKRWDSITEMPEISLNAYKEQMIRTHMALLYGVIHGMLKTHPSSRYDADKRIYALEDTEGDLTPLVVSNGTECDEFYEVLDSLYRDRASVAKIEEMTQERRKYDEQANHRFDESAFLRDLNSFIIGDGHKAPTSAFEIPLTYFNSLPRAKLDDNELAVMIDAVIRMIKNEVNRYEQDGDKAPFLAKRLEEQFLLLVENFNNDEYNENDAIRKNSTLADNRVINVAMRKVSNTLEQLNVSNFSERILALRKLVKG